MSHNTYPDILNQFTRQPSTNQNTYPDILNQFAPQVATVSTNKVAVPIATVGTSTACVATTSNGGVVQMATVGVNKVVAHPDDVQHQPRTRTFEPVILKKN